MIRIHQGMIGDSGPMRDVIAEARYVAERDSKVLITGESGVGKELLARFIHENSTRSRKIMASINCAAMTETLLESELFGHTRGSFTDAHSDREGLFNVANGGTVFLDEIGEMSARMQAMLLRVLENGEVQRVGSDRPHHNVDVRIICATNRDLLQQTQEKTFRLDLFYRLNVVNLVIPPLRERPGDIRLLFDHFVQQFQKPGAGPVTVAPEVYSRLEAYSWPGNIRELRNIAERTVLRGTGSIRVEDLPVEIQHERRVVSGAPGVVAAATLADVVAQDCFDRMVNGLESFWSVVYEPFMARDLTRETVRAIVYRALRETKGSYKALAPLFNMEAGDHKRLHSFLQQHDCHLPFQPFRSVLADDRRRMPRTPAKAVS